MNFRRDNDNSDRAMVGLFGPSVCILEKGFVLGRVPIYENDLGIKLVTLRLLKETKKAGHHPAVHVSPVIIVTGIDAKAKVGKENNGLVTGQDERTLKIHLLSVCEF